MGQHCGKNRYLKPENFSKEIVLRFNLGPQHLLDSFIDEILALDTTKSYLRKQIKVGRIVTQNLNKSAAISSFQKKNKDKSRFSNLILALMLKMRQTVCCDQSYNYLKKVVCT